MKNLYTAFAFTFCIIMAQVAGAQCPDGEVELELVVHTDAYAYEGYWEIVPSGNDCGNETLASGGNTAVGCNGAGDQDQTPGGYDSDMEITEGPWCVSDGVDFDLIYTDDWGDGGFDFDLYVNGYLIESISGTGLGGTYTFDAAEPPAYDLAITGSNLNQYVAAGSVAIEAGIINYGSETIEELDLNYSIDGGAVQSSNVSGLSIANYEEAEILHDIEWEITTFGMYEVAIWVSNPNGNTDTVPANDTLYATVEVGPGTPNIIDQYVNVSNSITTIAGSGEGVNKPTDLDFHPVLSNKELWVINKDTEQSGGSTVTIYNAGEDDQSETWKRDGNAWHFMSLPTGIAFSENGNFASSPGVYDANHNGGEAFTGPSLWSSDMSIYAEPSGGNGSHLDMLHQSPYSQGIAAEDDNVFWVFDGYSNDIVRNDFAEDHGPGNDYHADAKILRYAADEVARDPDGMVVSHLVLDEAKQWLYVVDHGNARIFRINITTGVVGGTPPYPANEPYEEYAMVTGYDRESVVDFGLSDPAGIDVIEDRMIVSEFGTGEIIVYDISEMPATELDRIETGFSSLQGIKIGPDGKIWGVDHTTNSVFRVEPNSVSVSEVAIAEPSVYPNPAVDRVKISGLESGARIQLFDMQGKLVKSLLPGNSTAELNLSGFHSGVYTLRVLYKNGAATRKIVKL